ncbi:acyl carrier protein [Amycolatopsis sp. WAC 01375]|uniref:phosphopantetheine-binding protein n=1 Tax=unclassified Amycolatopsis TaxID=2618356 RepID=UPI000F7792FE|nr:MULTISPECIES: phosphopantetheine-binding protein [unclassified Amycolatopsis]RSM79774.1 acyl carrier protein [Amycolatopsis sp. WAC 01375]RSN27386.1 acyl carrier protein [Amycolatopsis sp. WAC 01416]
MSLTTTKIHADVAELLGCDPAELTPDTDLTDLGLDSMRIMGLVEQWRTEGADTLEFADLAEQPTLGHWTRVLTGSPA